MSGGGCKAEAVDLIQQSPPTLCPFDVLPKLHQLNRIYEPNPPSSIHASAGLLALSLAHPITAFSQSLLSAPHLSHVLLQYQKANVIIFLTVPHPEHRPIRYNCSSLHQPS